MKKLFFLLPVLIFAEINPFNAGNLESPNPYGLTPQEKAILQNKNAIKKNSAEINSLKTKINKINSKLTQKLLQYDQSISDLNEKLSSFNTILSEIDAANQSIEKVKKSIKDLNKSDIYNKINSLEERVSNVEKQIDAIKASIGEITNLQNKNFEFLSNSIQTILQQLKEIGKPKKISPKKAFADAKKAYFSGDLQKAKELFTFTLNKKYLPATSSYYLGEIAYRQKKYKEALAFYKKSITLYPKKTSFSDRLLYHTALSFKKLGQKKSAKLTFQKLINDYPSSKYSKLAKKELNSL